MPAQKSTLVFSDWVKIGGYVIGILAIIFGYRGTQPTQGSVNLSMPVRAVRQQATEDTVKLHQEIAEVKIKVEALMADKEKARAEQEVVNKQETEKQEAERQEAERQEAERKKEEERKAAEEKKPAPVAQEVVDDGKEVPWQYDESEAKTLARKLKRPLGIAFATDSCPICENVKMFTYKNPKVWGVLHTKYVLLWVYVGGDDKAAFNKALGVANEYGVSKYPRFIIDRKANGGKDIFIMPSTNPEAFLSQIQ